MKQLFGLFCALILMPSFSAHAWIGGPFSGNSFFSNQGEDGVYEGIAIPVPEVSERRFTTTNQDADAFGRVEQEQINGIGIFRWAVANNVTGVDASDVETRNTTTDFFFGNGSETVSILPSTSNIYFGGFNQVSHTWFIAGVSYTGLCNGTVNGGAVTCVGQADQATDPSSTGGQGSVGASFSGTIDESGENLPVTRFTGSGVGTAYFTPFIVVRVFNNNGVQSGIATIPNPDTASRVDFNFNVFGSRVTTQVIINGESR